MWTEQVYREHDKRWCKILFAETGQKIFIYFRETLARIRPQ
jgi:hypothetical protein